MTDPDIQLVAREWTVSVTETRSLDEYEPFKPHVSLEGTVPEVPLDAAARKAIKARLLTVSKDLTEIVERTAENREADVADWGVPENGGEDER